MTLGSSAYWAADSIATSIEAAGARSRAHNAIRTQQAYHCGDIVIQRAALSALAELEPEHPLLHPLVQERIFDMGKATFQQSGWSKGCSVEVDPRALFKQLCDAHEKRKADLLAQAKALDVLELKRGIPLINRRTVYRYDVVDYATLEAAEQAKHDLISTIEQAQLGDLTQV
jgi:hypothetical protein